MEPSSILSRLPAEASNGQCHKTTNHVKQAHLTALVSIPDGAQTVNVILTLDYANPKPDALPAVPGLWISNGKRSSTCSVEMDMDMSPLTSLGQGIIAQRQSIEPHGIDIASTAQ